MHGIAGDLNEMAFQAEFESVRMLGIGHQRGPSLNQGLAELHPVFCRAHPEVHIVDGQALLEQRLKGTSTEKYLAGKSMREEKMKQPLSMRFNTPFEEVAEHGTRTLRFGFYKLGPKLPIFQRIGKKYFGIVK
ncbi:hypothetical protein [Verrucomicrobium sp. BvORR106]|uniref:hypothetical protein n=1 Tax=Verrucomicrobium sp. BvORR106 TaxID=1403819 RepID=UPI00224105BA|nr:hypothetical protein [Verrucomicrobium sp. BvORR106]